MTQINVVSAVIVSLVLATGLAGCSNTLDTLIPPAASPAPGPIVTLPADARQPDGYPIANRPDPVLPSVPTAEDQARAEARLRALGAETAARGAVAPGRIDGTLRRLGNTHRDEALRAISGEPPTPCLRGAQGCPAR
jgi:hypothetical protein